MAIRDKISAEARQYLEPGESVMRSLAGTSRNPYLGLISYWLIVFHDSQRAVVATDRRIIVFRTSRWRWTKFRASSRACRAPSDLASHRGCTGR